MFRLLLMLACVWHAVIAVPGSTGAAFPMCAELFRAALGAKSEHRFGEGGARAARGGWGIKIFSDGREVHRAADPVGNLFRTPEMHDRVYGKGGVLKRVGSTEVEHDADGNLIRKTLADGAVWQYYWDALGRLSRVDRPDGQEVTFSYDAFGRRLSKTFAGKTTEYIWDGDDLVHERVRQDGEIGALTTWVFEPGTFVPLAKIEGRKRFGVVTDHLGTPNVLTTEAGALAWKAQLDIYGLVREESAGVKAADATANPWRYPGQYEDAETGLYYNRYRYYDPETGRYISEDPIGLAGGVGIFRYPGDSSRRVDPLGLSCGPSGGKPALKDDAWSPDTVAARSGTIAARNGPLAAQALGFTRSKFFSHGQPVYSNGRLFITPDIDSHSGGIWKMASSPKNLGAKSTRMGTYDVNLVRIGD